MANDLSKRPVWRPRYLYDGVYMLLWVTREGRHRGNLAIMEWEADFGRSTVAPEARKTGPDDMSSQSPLCPKSVCSVDMLAGRPTTL